MKKAVIFGSQGQDGRIAFDLLAAKGYGVVGLGRNTVNSHSISWSKTVDVTNASEVSDLIKSIQPDEIYYLAACHHSSQDKIENSDAIDLESHLVNVEGLRYCLEAIAAYSKAARLFYASSCLIFENTPTQIQDEKTHVCPLGIYGITKLKGQILCREFRAKGVFASVGILYNHESFLRQDSFISKRIVRAAVNIKNGKQANLVVGDLNAVTDWGYAPDYVEAMHKIMQLPTSDEFIIATGARHTVRDFIQTAFDCVGLDWTKYVIEDKSLLTRRRKILIGNPHKLTSLTGWQPSVDFKGMVRKLIAAQEVLV